MKIHKLCNKYIKNRSRELSENTFIKYNYYIDLIFDNIPNYKLQKIKVNKIYQIRTEMCQKYSTATVKQVFSLLNTIVNYGVFKGYVKYNAIAHMPNLRTIGTNRSILKSDELKIIYENCTSDKWKIITLLFVYTSRRRGEIASIKYENLDFDNNTVFINSNLQYSPKIGIYEKNTKTGNSYLDLLPRKLMEMIKNYCKNEKINQGYLFRGTKKNKPMLPDVYTRYYSRLGKRLGIKISPHKFRHLVATIMYASGASDGEVSAKLGHKDINVTRKIYIHPLKQEDYKLIKILNNKYQILKGEENE